MTNKQEDLLDLITFVIILVALFRKQPKASHNYRNKPLRESLRHGYIKII